MISIYVLLPPSESDSLNAIRMYTIKAVTIGLLVSLGFYVVTFLVVLSRRRNTLFGVMLLFVIASQGAFCTAYTCIKVV